MVIDQNQALRLILQPFESVIDFLLYIPGLIDALPAQAGRALIFGSG